MRMRSPARLLALCSLHLAFYFALQLVPQAQAEPRRWRTGEEALQSDLHALTSSGRDSASPDYDKMASWVAGRLADSGVTPAGNGGSGTSGFLQPFAWDDWYPHQRARSENVVGVRRGDGSTNEAIVVVAHLDGLKLSGYQGANDNASGVAGALFISDSLAKMAEGRGRPLRRDVIFLISSAEERGLLGAAAFARFGKQFSDKKIVSVVNLEMVGRGDLEHTKLYGGDNAAEAAANPVYRRAMDIRHRGTMARVLPGHEYDGGLHAFRMSDHAVMAKAGVPSVMYVGALDDYHTARDTVEKLNSEMIKGVSRHALRLVTQLADDPSPMEAGAMMPISNATGLYGREVYPVESVKSRPAGQLASQRSRLGAELHASLRSRLGAELRASLRSRLGAELRASLRSRLGADPQASQRSRLGADPQASQRSRLGAGLRN